MVRVYIKFVGRWSLRRFWLVSLRGVGLDFNICEVRGVGFRPEMS